DCALSGAPSTQRCLPRLRARALYRPQAISRKSLEKLRNPARAMVLHSKADIAGVIVMSALVQKSDICYLLIVSRPVVRAPRLGTFFREGGCGPASAGLSRRVPR